MKQLWLMLCAAFLFLAASAAPAALPRSPAPASSAASEAPAPGRERPAAARPAAGPVQDPEALTAALDGCVAFGPGEAGASLKTAAAAAGLLNWAESSAKDSSIDSIEAHFAGWIGGLEAERQGLFWANWPAVDSQAWAIVRDMDGQRPLLADAGDPQRYDRYTPACYERLSCGVERFLEAD